MIVGSIVADVILVVSILMFCKIIFGFQTYDNVFELHKILLVVFAVIGASVEINLGDNVILETILYVSIVEVITCIFFKDKKISIIISTLWTMVIMEMLDTMLVVLVDMVAKIIEVTNVGAEKMARATILLIFVAIIGKQYNKNYSNGIKTIGKGGLVTFTVMTIVNSIIVMVIANGFIEYGRLERQKIDYLAFVLVILGLYVQLGSVILLLMQRNIYKEAQQLTGRYLEEQKNHYEYLEKRERETKKFRHDLRSHMEMLVALVKEHRYDELEKYMNKINVNIDKIGNVVSVQNGIVDAIINKYYSEASNQNMEMKVRGRFPRECEIEAYDLCTIFSNILSNAIEGAAEVEKGWISIECKYTEDNMMVVVKNTFDSKNPLRKGFVGTHKRNIDYHGFGLENVRETVKKYNGVCDSQIYQSVYSIRISMNYRSAKK